MPAKGRISGKEVAKHDSRESCWIIVHGTSLELPIVALRLVMTVQFARQCVRCDGFFGWCVFARFCVSVMLKEIQNIRVCQQRCLLGGANGSRWKQDYTEICREGCDVRLLVSNARMMPYHFVRQEYDPIHPPNAITTHLPRDKQLAIFCSATARKL